MSILHLQKAQSKPQTSLYIQDSTKLFEIMAYCPFSREDRLGHWTTVTQLFCSWSLCKLCGQHRDLCSVLQRVVQMFTKELLGFVGRVFTPRVTSQDSRISVMLPTFSPWNCSFQTPALTSFKELALHEPKSLPPSSESHGRMCENSHTVMPQARLSSTVCWGTAQIHII